VDLQVEVVAEEPPVEARHIRGPHHGRPLRIALGILTAQAAVARISPSLYWSAATACKRMQAREKNAPAAHAAQVAEGWLSLTRLR